MNQSTFKSKLNSILKDNAIERFVGGKKKGKIDNRKLFKISHSTKIFKQKEERKGKDYGITLILDGSGSMDGIQREVLASMDNIGLALNKSDIPLSIYGFSENVRLIKPFSEKYVSRTVREVYSKFRSDRFGVCRQCGQYDVPITSDAMARDIRNGDTTTCPFCNNESVWSKSNGSTYDALALHMVANEVYKTNAKNIIIIITDGQGDDLSGYTTYKVGKVTFADLKNNRTVATKLKKKHEDLILLAISIGSDHTKEVYGSQYSKNISDPKEVFNAVATLLARHIKRG